MERSSPGAQTERRGDAGPVRDLLGGKAAPAAILSETLIRNSARNTKTLHPRRWFFAASQVVSPGQSFFLSFRKSSRSLRAIDNSFSYSGSVGWSAAIFS